MENFGEHHGENGELMVNGEMEEMEKYGENGRLRTLTVGVIVTMNSQGNSYREKVYLV